MNRVNHRVQSGTISLHAVTEGDPGNEALVLVHGYPDNHHIWDRVVEKLIPDFYLVRYDVRGAGLSDKPDKTRDYRLQELARDLEAVVDQLLPGRAFHLAAHDWGSIQSWESVTSGSLSGRIRSYSSISGPCLDHVGYWLREQATDLRGGGTAKVLRQLASSWYVFLFQLPVVPETLWRLGLDRAWPDILRKHEGITNASFSELQQGDGLFGVKLYRANFLPRLWRPALRHAQCPVQLIIPKGDNYVGEQLFERQVRWTGKLTRRKVDAPHWAPLTAPGLVADAIREFAFAGGWAG
ncbi:MAG: alpha/beta fold hydrolase [Marinobacter sp.]|uniref:alpha/beta fold hydrolase n=1 Tax=Marinobacter sp. TaxID=50741 RepID=UPI00396D6AEE